MDLTSLDLSSVPAVARKFRCELSKRAVANFRCLQNNFNFTTTTTTITTATCRMNAATLIDYIPLVRLAAMENDPPLHVRFSPSDSFIHMLI
jgi:hypothetical protein